MSYANSVFFVPVWFDDYKTFAKEMAGDARWAPTDLKLWADYLFRYACNIARPEFNLLSSFTLEDLSTLNVYMPEKELGWTAPPIIEEVRLSCFASGVGFMEFWVAYTDKTPDEIATEYEKNTGLVIAETFADIDPDRMPAVLVNSHAPFTWGKNAKKSVESSVILEEVARMAQYTELLQLVDGIKGGVRMQNDLLRKHFDRKHGPGAYYGQGGEH